MKSTNTWIAVFCFASGILVSHYFIQGGIEKDRAEVYDMWKTAYGIGYEDGSVMATARYKMDKEQLRTQCMLLHFKDTGKKREKP